MAPTVPRREVFSASRRWCLRPATVVTLAAALSCGDETMPDPPEPARVTIGPSSLEFAALQDTARLSAQVHDQYGSLMADGAVTWASSDASVASVDASGLVRSVGNGEAVVAATAGSASGTAEATVAQVVTAVNMSPELLEFSALGDTLRLEAEPVDANGHDVEGAVVTWSSGDPGVATVDTSGLVRSMGSGEAVVTATAGSASGTAEATVAQVVTAVNMSPELLEFSALGDTLRLEAEPVDANGHDVEGAAVTWSSGDPGVATVDSEGLVRSVGNGEAVVTATAGSASGTAEATVAQVVTAVNMSPELLEFSALGDTLRLEAEAVDANGRDVEGAVVTWSSGDPGVATVDSEGLVRSVGNGEAVVSATAGSVSGTAEATVAQVVTAVNMSPELLEFSALGDTLRLEAEPVDANGRDVEGAVVTWSSGDPGVATVDASGLVRSVGNGEAVVTATAGSVSGTAEATVAQVVTAVNMSPELLEFSALGDTLRLEAEPVDANGHPVEGAVVTWSSGDPGVATVDSEGLVRSVGNGEAVVSATAGSVSGTAEAAVAQVVTAVNMSPELLEFSALGDTLRLEAEPVDANGHPADGVAVTWSSGDPGVATVDTSGLVRSVGNGEATVTATAGSASDTAYVTVAQVASVVSVSPELLEFSALGDTLRLEAEPVDANGHDVEGALVTWSSGDPGVATVDSEGLVRSVGNGEAVVTATAGSVSGTAEATVAQVVTAVNMSPELLEFSALGDTLRLEAEPVDANSHPVDGVAVTWSSGDTAVVVVDTSGLVRSVGRGEAVVTATAGSVSGTAEATVAHVVTAVNMSPELLEFSALGDTLRLEAEPVDANGYPVEGVVVTWASGDTAVVVVDTSGLVRSVGSGEAVVTATAGSVSGTAEATVAQVVTAVNMSPELLEFSALADTLRLEAEPVDANGHDVEGAVVTWSSGDPGVATVDTSGLVRSAGNGKAVVTATSGSASDSAEVTVAQVVSTVNVSPDAVEFSALGDTLRLEAEPVDANGHDVEGAVVTWSSGDPGVATVDSAGLVEAVGYGAATVTATMDSVSGSAEIRVEEDLDRAALVALYEATGGPSWRSNYKWLTTAPLGEWHGIDVDEEGRVTIIALRENRLTGSLPPELANLTNLKVLLLQYNQITGEIPAWLGTLRHLEEIDLGRNKLAGSIPPELGGLSELDRLLLGRNQLNGRIPVELGNLPKLTSLSVVANKLSGQIPSELGNLSALTNLNLAGNGLSGPIPPELGKLSNLLYLRLESNDLEGELPSELGNLRRLKWLFLQFNSRLTGSIRILGSLTSLEQLQINRCGFDGPIPPELGNLSKLGTLLVSRSNFTGTIPKELGRMSSLEQLLVIHNEYITGPIPRELGDLPQLRLLDLRNNDLTGPVPPELAAAPNLVNVFLGDNRLSGPIPPELGDAPKLTLLSLRRNELSGPVPPEIGSIETLTGLNLAGNTEMTGVLPTTMTALKNLESLSTGNTGLCAPDDPGFRKWLRGLVYQRVALCDPPAAYLVQAVQSRPYPVPLIAEEPALLRVFVTATKKTDVKIPPVRATFYQDDEEVHTVTIAAKSAIIPTEVDESSLTLSSNAEIPDSVLDPELEMVIEIDPDSTMDADLLVTNRIPEVGRASVEVNDAPLLDLTVIPLLWEEDPDSSVLELTEDMTDEDTLFTDTHMLLPVGEMDVTVHETVWSSTNDIFTLLTEVTALRTNGGRDGPLDGHHAQCQGGRRRGVCGRWLDDRGEAQGLDGRARTRSQHEPAPCPLRGPETS